MTHQTEIDEILDAEQQRRYIKELSEIGYFNYKNGELIFSTYNKRDFYK